MNFGTGGANVSFDNLVSALRGLQVWGVNSQISRYGRQNDFDALIALRAQYGYGDSTQVGQLWDILKGNVLLDTGAERDFRAMTTLGDDGKRVVSLTGYQQGMSAEQQFLLAVVLGHEAYRDGIVTADNYLETRTATLAHTQMAMRMIYGGETIAFDTNLANDFTAYFAALARNDMDVFNAYVDANYDSSADYWKLIRRNNGAWLWEDDRKADFDITELHSNTLFGADFNISKMRIMQAMIFSHEIDGKDYGVISNHRMTNALAYDFGQVISRIAINDISNRFLRNIQPSAISLAMVADTLDKIAYNAVNTFTVWDSQNRPVTMHSINLLNDTDLQKQTDFRDIPNLFNSGCNFMNIIGVPQILFRQELTDQQIRDIWNEAIENEIIRNTGFVNNRTALAELALLKLGITNIGIDIGSTSIKNASIEGYRQQMPFGTNGNHFVITGTNRVLFYNPSNYMNHDQNLWTFLEVWAYGK